MPRNGSQAGYAILLAHLRVLEGPADVVLLDTVSTRMKLAVRSSMAAEMASASLATELAEFARCSLAEMVFGHFTLRSWQTWSRRWRMVLAIDARTGFDTLQGEGTASDKRVAIDIAAIREALLEAENNASVRWLPGPQHVADGLTKAAGNGILEQVACEGVWSLRECETARTERAGLRDQRRAAATRRASENAPSAGPPRP